MLSNEDIKRYSRQLMLEEIGEKGQQNIAQSHVVIVGLGGLGALCARYLVGAGVGKVTLVDGDTVDISNLQRQVTYNEIHLGDLKAKALYHELKKVNPNTNLNFKGVFVDSDNLPTIISDATCVLDCSDNIVTRKHINHACITASTPLFIAAASGLTWQAINVSPHDKATGCYACLVDHIDVREDCISQGVLGPVVGLAACHQTTQTLLFLALRENANIQWGHYISGNAAKGTMQSFSLTPSSFCEVCQ